MQYNRSKAVQHIGPTFSATRRHSCRITCCVFKVIQRLATQVLKPLTRHVFLFFGSVSWQLVLALAISTWAVDPLLGDAYGSWDACINMSLACRFYSSCGVPKRWQLGVKPQTLSLGKPPKPGTQTQKSLNLVEGLGKATFPLWEASPKVKSYVWGFLEIRMTIWRSPW